MEFDPNGPSYDSESLFGLPPLPDQDPRLIVIPVEFEATTSYLGGTSKAPRQVLQASQQVDLFHPLAPEAWKEGIIMLPFNSQIPAWNEEAKALVKDVRDHHEDVTESQIPKAIQEEIDRINEIGECLTEITQKLASEHIKQNQIVGLMGGDHSTPLGSIKAHVESFGSELGILHIDAHFDLRNSYEGFKHSHASIMFNVLDQTNVTNITSIGLRDYCSEEADRAFSDKRVNGFTAHQMMEWKAEGKTWKSISEQILECLPSKVYISMDIDGLDPAFCPHTGTAVPGGLDYQEVVYLLREIYRSGKKIVGFDLVEVGPGEYDANVGARLLYEMSSLAIASQKT